MKSIKRIMVCLLAACVLMAALQWRNLDMVRMDEDTILVDSETSADEIDEEALYEELFDIHSKIQIDVDISKDELAKLQADYEYYSKKNSKSPIYRMAKSVTFHINGKKYVVKEVGIRMKGNSSRTNFYNDLLGIYNLVNFKLSFNETFDNMNDYSMQAKAWKAEDEDYQRRKRRTFATMDKLEVKWNITADNTYVRNTYMNEAFTDFGIPAQKCRLAVLKMSGSSLGVYKIFEPINEEFLRRYLPSEDLGGNLYKVRCTDRMPATYSLHNDYGICNRNDVLFYNFDLKTNQENPDYSDIRHLLALINREDVTPEELEAAVDMEWFAKFCAINCAMGNQDDLRTTYNNHYLYFRKSDGKAIFLPYDCEVCLGDTFSWDPSGSAMTDVSPYNSYNYRYAHQQENALVNLTVRKGAMFEPLYTRYLNEVSHSKWMTVAQYQTYYEPCRANYSGDVISPYNYMSTMGRNMAFSMEGGETCNGNLSIEEFFDRMQATLRQYTDA